MRSIMLSTVKDYPAYEFYKKNGFKEAEGIVVLCKE